MIRDRFFIAFLIFAFLNDFGMFYSLYNYIFSISQMSVFQISTILSICQIGKVIFDIPSGILNDKLNKKAAFYIGLIAKITAMLIFIHRRDYSSFLLAMFLIGISWSCVFGKLETFLYSEIENKKTFSKKLGAMYSFINLSIAIASYTASMIKDINIILYIQIIIYILGIIFLFLIKTKKISSNFTPEEPMFKLNFFFFKKIRDKFIAFTQYLLQQRKIKNFIILSIFLESLFIIMIDLNTNLMIKFDFSKESISKIVSFVAFIRIFTNLISGHLVSLINLRIFILYFVAIFVQIIFFTTFFPKFSFIAISVYLCFYAPLSLFVSKTIQENIDDKNRNLILSAINMSTSIVSVFIDFSFGFLGWINGVRLLSILLIVFIFYAKSHIIFTNLPSLLRKKSR